MPLYEYKCETCDAVFEVIQKFSDEPLTEHEGCGGRVERLISSSAFQFKGTGWYITDYARKGSSKGGSNGKNESSGEKKRDPKPAVSASKDSTSKSS